MGGVLRQVARWFAVAAAMVVLLAVIGVVTVAVRHDLGVRVATYTVPISGLPEIQLRSKAFLDSFGYAYLRDGWNPIPRQLCLLPIGWWVMPKPPPRAFPPRAGW